MLRKNLVKSLIALVAFSSNHLYAASCHFTLQSEWNTGFTSSISITNDTDQIIDGWTASIDFAGSASINNMWNASLSGNGPYQAVNKSYNGTIQPNSTVQFGFNSQKSTSHTPALAPTLGGICANSTGNNLPTAIAAASPLEGSIPLSVNFDASGSVDPDGDDLSYLWQFEDGTTANSVTATRTFAEAGDYTVLLTVNDGEQDSTTSITINAHLPEPTSAQCEYVLRNEWNTGFTSAVKITNVAQQAINDWTVLMQFPDGSSISHIWNANLSGSNPYQASNKSYNKTIWPNSTVEFGFNSSKSASGVPAEAPVLSGICAPTNSNQPPVANAAVSPLQGTAPLTVNFNASGSTDPDGDNLSYQWDFGDGNFSSEPATTHTYSDAGTYTASLTVTDTALNSDTATITITAEDDVNQPPTAQATASPTQGTAPLTVNFNASGSTDPDGDNLSYQWDFGDGTSSNDSITTHTYPDVGNYTASLTVTDTASNSDTATITITVTDGSTPPPAYILDAERSSLHFVSTKKVHVVETHTFTGLSGDISAEGAAVVRIDLDTVDTGIDIRNQRMREFLFETVTFSQAEVTLNVDMDELSNIPIGNSLEQAITPTVNLHGFNVPIAAQVNITRLSAETILVQNTSPILVNAADFGLTGGIDILKDLASLSVISYSVPTNFTLLFNIQ